MKDIEEIVEDWSRYVNQVINGASTSAVSEAMGGTPSEGTIRNWVNGDLKSPPDIMNVRRFAETYGRPLNEAFAIASGVRLEEVGETTVMVKPDPSLLTDEEFAHEFLERAKGGHHDHPLATVTRREVTTRAEPVDLRTARRRSHARQAPPL